jgi:hypothetical protein
MNILQRIQYWLFMLDPRQRTAIYGEGALDRDLPIGILIGLAGGAVILDITALYFVGFLIGMYLIVKLIIGIERGEKK